MTGVIVKPEQVRPCSESSSVVKSLRMQFERTGDALEGVVVNKSPEPKISSKALESIKKFESLAKKEPGFKPNSTLEKLSPINRSIRVGSLKHKFESLANRSLSADLFNAPGEYDEDPRVHHEQQVAPRHLSESVSVCDDSDLGTEVKPEGEADANLIDTSVTEVLQHVVLPVTQGDAINEEMSTFSVESEGSLEEPILCLKDQIERAQIDEVRACIVDTPTGAGMNEQNVTVTNEPVENIDALVKAPSDDADSYNMHSTQNPRASEGSNIDSSNPYTGNSSTAMLPDSESRGQTTIIAVSNAARGTEDSPEVKKSVVPETNDSPEGVPVQTPVEIGMQSQPRRHKPPGFFQRLFTCGASI